MNNIPTTSTPRTPFVCQHNPTSEDSSNSSIWEKTVALSSETRKEMSSPEDQAKHIITTSKPSRLNKKKTSQVNTPLIKVIRDKSPQVYLGITPENVHKIVTSDTDTDTLDALFADKLDSLKKKRYTLSKEDKEHEKKTISSSKNKSPPRFRSGISVLNT